jgi:hypothetical protein
MAQNQLLQPSIITKRTLAILINNLVMGALVNRQFEESFVKIGSTITIRKPNRFSLTRGPTLQIQNVVEPYTSLTIGFQSTIGFQFSSTDLTLTIEEYSDRYLKPIAETIANGVDSDIIANYLSVYNVVGTAGDVPNNYQALANVGQKMDFLAMPQGDRNLVLGPNSYWPMTVGLSSLYVTSAAEPALKGFLARIANFNIYLDQNIQQHTNGLAAGSGAVNGANQSGSQLVTNGWTASTTNLFNVGDVITIGTGSAQVFAVNPQNYRSTGQLANFVITAAASSDAGGNATLNISPALTPPGSGPIPNPYANVPASPVNGAAITLIGTGGSSYYQDLAFVRDAFGLVTVPMELPDGNVDFKYRQEYKGFSLRIIRGFDIWNDVWPARVDCLYGTTAFYPEVSSRLTN